MAEDFNFGHMTGVGQDGVAEFKRPPNIAFFYAKSELMPFASKEAGRPIYEPRDFVKLVTPGERDEVDREVQEWDKRAYREQWIQYKEQREQVAEGTPLLHLFPGNPEIVDNLRGLKFQTIEQLAEAPDTALKAIAMGAYDYQAKARRFLEGTKDASRFGKIERQLEELASATKAKDDEIASLKAEIAVRDRKAAKAA